MNIVRLSMFLSMLLFSCVLSFCLDKVSTNVLSGEKEFKELNRDFKFFPLSNRPMDLPDDSFISSNIVSSSEAKVNAAIKDTVGWLRRMVKSEWLPSDIEERFIALRCSWKGADALWARYQADNYAIQILSDSGYVGIDIRDVSRREKVDIYNRLAVKKFIEDAVDMFLERADLIKENLPDIEQYIYDKELNRVRISRRAPYSGRWWEEVRWVSDGYAIRFILIKWEYRNHRPALAYPRVLKEWF